MRRVLLLAAAVTAVVALAAPDAHADVPPFTGPPGGPKVAAVGDSLLGQLQSEGPTHPHSTQAFTLTLNDQGWRASVTHRNAWRTARVRKLVNQVVDRGAEVVIVVAGSGDIRWVRESPDPAAARQQIGRAIRLTLRDLEGTCVVWPTIPVRGNAGERRTAHTYNDELLEASAAQADQPRNPDVAQKAVDHPEWFISDGVHLSPSGEAAFQRFLVHAARTCVEDLDD